MIIVEHEAIVKANKAKKVSASNTKFVNSSHTEDKHLPFRRSFSLFGVALSMLSEITGIGPDSKKVQLLKFHRKSIAVCYILAICLRRIVQSDDNVTTICDDLSSSEGACE